MTLAEILEQLTYGELSQLAMGGWDDGIRREDLPKVLAHINLGLKELYKRFWLSSKEVLVQLHDHIQVYTLDKHYAATNTLSPAKEKYIIDSVYQPFQNDLLKIEQVFNENGELMYLNDLTEPWSLFTPSYNQLQVPFPEHHNILLVHYRASHPKIELRPDEDPKDVQVMLPEGLLEPLLLYVGYRAFGSLTSVPDAESSVYLQKFENSVQNALKAGLQISTCYGNMRLDNQGWV
jgi:hypothetical protein